MFLTLLPLLVTNAWFPAFRFAVVSRRCAVVHKWPERWLVVHQRQNGKNRIQSYSLRNGSYGSYGTTAGGNGNGTKRNGGNQQRNSYGAYGILTEFVSTATAKRQTAEWQNGKKERWKPGIKLYICLQYGGPSSDVSLSGGEPWSWSASNSVHASCWCYGQHGRHGAVRGRRRHLHWTNERSQPVYWSGHYS